MNASTVWSRAVSASKQLAPLGNLAAVENERRSKRTGNALRQCSDGKDNDVDGYDPGCRTPVGESEVDPGLPEKPACGDRVDNDGDGYVDLVDPGCLAADDVDELPANAVPACKDGMDNDADGLVDLGDPDCGDPNGLSELAA